MNRDEYSTYLKSPRWRQLSLKKKKAAGWRCQLCNGKGKLHCHHRSYDRIGTSGEYYDIIVLCRRCHRMIHLSLLHTEQALVVNKAGSLLYSEFSDSTDPFEQFLFRKLMRYLGVLHIIKNEDISIPLLLDLRDHIKNTGLKNSVWDFVHVFLFGTDRDVKDFAGDRDYIADALRIFLNKIAALCRDEFNKENEDETDETAS